MLSLQHLALRTDISGMPLDWVDYREAVRLYHLGNVAYACGNTLYRVHGGICAKTGRQSVIVINSIIAIQSSSNYLKKKVKDYVPPLSNVALFARDAYICMYCGVRHSSADLSRDHVRPLSKGGSDNWNNVVTACKRCNNHKAGFFPEEVGMSLLAVPFTPTHAEYVYLRGRKVLADQMEFLLAHFSRSSPIHDRVARLINLGDSRGEPGVRF